MWIPILICAAVVGYVCRLLSLGISILPVRPKGFPPGPLALPFVGNLPWIIYYGSLYQTFQSLGSKFGPIFSVFIGSTPAVVLNSIDAFKESGKLDEFQGRPDVPTFTLRDDSSHGYVGGIVISEGHVHTEQRKFVVKTLRQLAGSNVSIENLFIEEISSVTEHFRSLVGQPFDIRNHLEQISGNVLRKFLVGIPNEETKSVQDYKKILAPDNAMKTRPVSSFFIAFYSKLAKLFPDLSGYNLYATEHKRSNAALRQIIENHLSVRTGSREESPPSFLNSYFAKIESTTDENSTFYGRTGLQNLTMVIKDMSTAGTETFSEQTTWFILYLLSNPEMRDKIVEEIQSVVGIHRAPTKCDFNEMHYTQAALLEVMRITSVVDFGLFNKTLETTTFRRFVIPKGTMVIRNSYAAHHDKNYWGDPENFRPERFLDDEGKFRKDENVFAFGYGRRVCVGESQGKFGILYFITLFLQKFDLSLDVSNPSPTLEPVEAVILVAKPFQIVLHERLK